MLGSGLFWEAGDDAVLQDWLAEVKKSLNQEVYEKAQHYAYDFNADRPLVVDNPRFHWESSTDKECVEPPAVRNSSLSTVPSATPEVVAKIPDLDCRLRSPDSSDDE